MTLERSWEASWLRPLSVSAVAHCPASPAHKEAQAATTTCGDLQLSHAALPLLHHPWRVWTRPHAFLHPTACLPGHVSGGVESASPQPYTAGRGAHTRDPASQTLGTCPHPSLAGSQPPLLHTPAFGGPCLLLAQPLQLETSTPLGRHVSLLLLTVTPRLRDCWDCWSTLQVLLMLKMPELEVPSATKHSCKELLGIAGSEACTPPALHCAPGLRKGSAFQDVLIHLTAEATALETKDSWVRQDYHWGFSPTECLVPASPCSEPGQSV